MREPVEVHHRVDGGGDRAALVLSGSLATTLEMWDPQMPSLIERFRVIRYDLRGHGRSPAGAAPFGVEDLGADLVGLLDRLGLERAHLCGLSLGGMATMWVAATAPERVDRLVLCATSTRIGTRQSWGERAAAVRAGGMASIADTVLGIWFTPGFRARRADDLDRFRGMLLSTDPDVYAACCDLLGRTDLADRLSSIRARTLAIAGSEDPSTPPEHARSLAAGIRGARTAVIDGAAHLVNVERPAEFDRAVLTHLLEATPEEER